MCFNSSASGRACLVQWDTSINVSSVFALLADLNRIRMNAGAPTMLILVTRSTVPLPPSHVLNSLRGALPALLNLCRELLVAIEGSSPDRTLLRAAFIDVGGPKGEHKLPKIFDTLSEAFAHAQGAAPHDVLELQRLVLRQSFPPYGQWT